MVVTPVFSNSTKFFVYIAIGLQGKVTKKARRKTKSKSRNVFFIFKNLLIHNHCLTVNHVLHVDVI